MVQGLFQAWMKLHLPLGMMLPHFTCNHQCVISSLAINMSWSNYIANLVSAPCQINKQKWGFREESVGGCSWNLTIPWNLLKWILPTFTYRAWVVAFEAKNSAFGHGYWSSRQLEGRRCFSVSMVSPMLMHLNCLSSFFQAHLQSTWKHRNGFGVKLTQTSYEIEPNLH